MERIGFSIGRKMAGRVSEILASVISFLLVLVEVARAQNQQQIHLDTIEPRSNTLQETTSLRVLILSQSPILGLTSVQYHKDNLTYTYSDSPQSPILISKRTKNMYRH